MRDQVADQVLVRLFDRSRESVPAGFPEPYLYDRFTSGSEVRVGGETASR